MKIKHLILLVLITSIGSIIYGFLIKAEEVAFAHKCIGLGTIGIFLIAMPLFLFTYSKGKNIKNYMLTEENIKKMQNKNSKTPDNK